MCEHFSFQYYYYHNSQVYHADSQHVVIDNHVYAPAELGWQYASDYAFLIGESAFKATHVE